MARDAVIHLIDDDDAVRHAVAFLLTSAGYAVWVYESGTAFLEALPTLQPGCVITDIRMPGVSGLELQKRLRELHAGFPVIILTGHADVALAVEAMKAGAIDFLQKPFDDDALIAAVRVAVNRHARDAGRENEIAATRARLAGLSRRETEVLDGMVDGRASKTIAYDLGLSVRTVEVHRANVMTKTGAGSLSELVRMVLVARTTPD